MIENNKEDDVYNVMAKNQAFLPEKKPILSLSPFKGFYKAAVAISLDYETSALYGNLANLNSRMRGRFFSLINKIYPTQKDLTFCYGIGYAMRRGADNITRILQNYKVHATWFSTGHVLLEENKKGKAFRADKILPYATEKAGFNDNFTWRNNKSISFYEPYSDYKRYPYWYFGDQALKLKLMGEDIQCHTFSHPYVAMEPPEDVKIDIEDWQNAAEANGFKKAGILAFPFGSDAYRYYYQLNLKTMIEKDIAGQDSVIITLADEVIEILQDNGIELITRCASKNKEECKGISYYNNSKLHYMSDLDITRWMKNPGSLDSTIKKIVDNKTTVNLWIHPSSVFTQEETKNFEILIRYLLDKEQKQEIWFTTISEIWDYFKKIEHCQLDITPYKEDKYKIVVENKNTSIIENLALDIVDPELCIIQRDDNIGQCGERALIKKVYPEKPYKFICQIKRQA